MAWGRHAPHTVESERPGEDERAVADTERLGVDTDLADRPAHAWEVDEAESWEPVVAETWDPPSADDAPTGDGATGHEFPRSKAGSDVGEAAPDEEVGHKADEDVRSAEHAADESVRSPVPSTRPDTGASDAAPPLTRMALGLASLAAQRLRGGVPAGNGLVTGLGLLRQTANGLVALGERMLGPASRVASIALKGAATLPVVGAPVRAGLRSRQWLASSTARAREPRRDPADGGGAG